MEHDIIVGKITNIIGENSRFHIGDLVIYFFDFYQFKICQQDPFMSLCVDDYYLFEIPPEFNITFKLPILKYGFLIFLLILLNKDNIPITIYSNYNIFTIIQGFIKNIINVNWKNCDDFNQLKNNYVLITNQKWIIKINNIIYTFDFNDNTIINIFGKNNISIVIDMFSKFKSFSSKGVIHIPFDYISENNNKISNNNKTRFFSIITFLKS
jgi:hypothetical protein